MKRFFDLIIALILIIILFPIMAVVAVLINYKIGSPIIFKQMRPGLNAKIFCLYKFRTMSNDRDKNGDLLPDSIRLTEFGKFLRKYSLDELPQLFNIVKGDLSLVGPRPLLEEYLELYTEEQALRHEVRPGITGLAQVSGRNSISWEDKLALDVLYVKKRSFLLDMKILFLTVVKVIKSEGVNQEGHATVEKFTGS